MYIVPVGRELAIIQFNDALHTCEYRNGERHGGGWVGGESWADYQMGEGKALLFCLQHFIYYGDVAPDTSYSKGLKHPQ